MRKMIFFMLTSLGGYFEGPDRDINWYNLDSEFNIDILPVLLCKGLRLFENIGEQSIQLEKIAVMDAPVRSHLRFRIVESET